MQGVIPQRKKRFQFWQNLPDNFNSNLIFISVYVSAPLSTRYRQFVNRIRLVTGLTLLSDVFIGTSVNHNVPSTCRHPAQTTRKATTLQTLTLIATQMVTLLSRKHLCYTVDLLSNSVHSQILKLWIFGAVSLFAARQNRCYLAASNLVQHMMMSNLRK